MPFRGKSVTDVLVQHAEDPPSEPSERREDLPDAFDAAILQALSKDPAERPVSALAFPENLEAARQPPKADCNA